MWQNETKTVVLKKLLNNKSYSGCEIVTKTHHSKFYFKRAKVKLYTHNYSTKHWEVIELTL